MNNHALRLRLNGLMTLTGVALTMCAIFVAIFFPWRMDLLATRWMEDRARGLASAFDQSMGEALDTEDPMRAQEALRGLENVADATYAQLRRADGQPMADWKLAAANGFVEQKELSEGVTLSDSQLHLVHVVKSKGGITGSLVMGFSLDALHHDRARSRFISAVVAAIMLVLGLSLVYITSAFLAQPIARLARATREIVETGDLTRSLDDLPTYNLGVIGNSVTAILQQQRNILGRINKLIDNVTEVVHRVGTAGSGVSTGVIDIQKRVEQTSRAAHDMLMHLQAAAQDVQTLERNAEMSQSSLENMAASNVDVVQSVGNMASSSAQTSAAIEHMAVSVGEIATNIEQLNAAVGETSSSMQRMDAAIEEVERSSRETARLSERVLSDADTGVDALQKTLQGIDNIKHSSSSAANVIGNLGQRISEIGAILRVIDEVAAQTKLLSLNAAIIASQAGEHGRGFSVVADQIKELAQRTGASTREISTLIQGIQEESRNATAAMDHGVTSVEVGVKLGHEAADALQKIRESANESTAMFKKIAQATVDQARNSKLITASIERIAHTVGQISNYSAEQANGAEQIIASSKHMSVLTDQVRRSSEEQTRGSKQVVQIIENINGMVARLGAAQKYQTKGADVVQLAVEEIRTISQGQTTALTELDHALSSLTAEAQALSSEVRKYKV